MVIMVIRVLFKSCKSEFHQIRGNPFNPFNPRSIIIVLIRVLLA